MEDLPELVEGVITHLKFHGRDVETRQTFHMMQELPAPLSYTGYPFANGDGGECVTGWVDLAARGDSGFIAVMVQGPRDASYLVEPISWSPALDEAAAREGAATLWRMVRATQNGLDDPVIRFLEANQRARTRRRLIHSGMAQERVDELLAAFDALLERQGRPWDAEEAYRWVLAQPPR
jgi:hypothetical protein